MRGEISGSLISDLFVSTCQIYVVEAEDDRGGEERADRDKRKIAVAKLGVSNGIINFVFNVRFVFDEVLKK